VLIKALPEGNLVQQGVSVNGLLSGGITGTTNFTAYISPYLVLNNGGYTICNYNIVQKGSIKI